MITSRVSIDFIFFTLVMNEITKDIQEDIPWCMLFADDVVLIDKSRIGVDQKLKLWRQTLESKNFKFSTTKIEYIWGQFSGDNSNDENVSLDGQVVSMNDTFRYLGSMLQSDGGINEDVSHRIRTEWVKWRQAYGIL
jgi:hypothetical protein